MCAEKAVKRQNICTINAKKNKINESYLSNSIKIRKLLVFWVLLNLCVFFCFL